MLYQGSCGTRNGGALVSEANHEVKRKGTFLKQPLQLWIRVSLGLIFVISSMGKIANPAAFAQSIYDYQILPDVLVNLTAIILPWLETLLGLLLISGFWLPGAVTLTNVLLVAFFGALVFNAARGLDVHCGCFSSSAEGGPATSWYLIRDAIFLLMGGYLFFKVFIGMHAIPVGCHGPSVMTRGALEK